MINQPMDLHIHSKNSDGKLTVKELLEVAEASGLSLISITDHNSVGGYDEIDECRECFSGKIIPGAELSTTYNGELFEVLAYGIDVSKVKKFISESYLSFKEKTLTERLMILEQYSKKGIVMSDEFCYNMKHNPTNYYNPENDSCRPPFLDEIKKHTENAKFFGGEKQMQETDNRTFFRNHYGRPSSPLYVDVSSLFPSVEKLLSAIHDADGYAFIAHSFVYSKSFIEDIPKIAEKYDIDGFECYYTSFTKEQTEYLIQLCDKNNMYKSGGSDFHGYVRPESIMGKATEGMKLDTSIINDWMKGIKNYV